MVDILFSTESDMTNIAFIHGNTEEGKLWLAGNIVPEMTHPYGIVVEKRYIPSIIEGIKDSGLTCRGEYI
jgi:hypothetical protein